MRAVWESNRSENLWYWWTKVPNGWTAWVCDPKPDGPTAYFTVAMAENRVVHGQTFKDFAQAKREAIALTLRQRPLFNRSFTLRTKI